MSVVLLELDGMVLVLLLKRQKGMRPPGNYKR